jgi:hypothetical protein
MESLLTAYSKYDKIRVSMFRSEMPMKLSEAGTAAHEADVVQGMANSMRGTENAIRAANKMKLFGTVGAFALAAVAEVAKAAIPPVGLAIGAVKSLTILKSVATGSEAVAKIAAVLAAVGVIKGTKNNMEFRSVRRKFNVVPGLA